MLRLDELFVEQEADPSDDWQMSGQRWVDIGESEDDRT